jgi:hypothetical protein
MTARQPRQSRLLGDVDNLRACYDTLEARKATGVDGVTKKEYGEELEENLRDLSERLKRMGYRPEPKRRSYIPKPARWPSRRREGRSLSLARSTRYPRPEAHSNIKQPFPDGHYLGCGCRFQDASFLALQRSNQTWDMGPPNGAEGNGNNMDEPIRRGRPTRKKY